MYMYGYPIPPLPKVNSCPAEANLLTPCDQHARPFDHLGKSKTLACYEDGIHGMLSRTIHVIENGHLT